MNRDDFITLIARVKGCTFAALDAKTTLRPGVSQEIMGEQVLIFSMRSGSGYENMVRRRLEEIGRDPASFSVGDLPWGERIPDSPLIQHKGNLYIQTIVIRPGRCRCFIGCREIDCGDPNNRSGYGQGLPDDRRVIVHTYRVDHIIRLTLLGETLKSEMLEGALAS